MYPSQSAHRSGQPTCAIAPYERVFLTGTGSAESIMASGHDKCRINRPHTWQLRPAVQKRSKTLDNTEPSTHGMKWSIWALNLRNLGASSTLFRPNKSFSSWSLAAIIWPVLGLAGFS